MAVILVSMAACVGSSGSTATVAPASILGWSPGITRGVPLTAPLSIYFTRAVNHAAVERSWRLTPRAPGRLRWAGTTLSFTPTRGLQPGSYYRLSVGHGARDDGGQALANSLDLSFSTGDPLKVIDVTPAAGTTDVPLNGLIAVTFNHPMVALAGLGVASPDPPGWQVSLSPRTAGHGSWLGTSSWVFHPDGGLIPSSRYSVTLRGTVRDAWGEALGADHRWFFQTAGPAVVESVPTNGASYVDPNGTIRITFNQPMDRTSTAAAFSLGGAGRVRGAVSWQGNTLVFTPSTPLDPGSRYSATVASSASAANGRATLGRAFHLSFQVAPLPRVVSALSQEGASVDFHFSSPMKQRSLDRRLTISPSLSNLSTWSSGTLYSISGSFQPSTSYTVTIDRGAQDRFGRILPDPYTMRFTTPPLPSSITLMGRPGIYTGITFSAGRVVDLQLEATNAPRVHYTLIHTDPAAVMKVAGGCGETPPAGATLRDWVAQVPHPLNRVERLGVRLAQRDGSPLAPGIYWLTAAIPPGSAISPVSAPLVASNVGITAKSGYGETLAWVTSPLTGRPLANLPARLLNADGSVVASGRTDARGLVFFHRSESERWAVVVDDGRHFGMTFSDWTVQAAQYDRPSLFSRYASEPNGAYAYTDRPIYRPGQQVHFRAVLWRDHDAQYSLYGPRTVQVQSFENPTNGGGGSSLYTARLRLDRFGSVHGTFRLPARAATGTDGLTFNLDLGRNQQVFTSTQFSVAEYRKPEFLTTVSTDRPSYVKGQAIGATVEVKYVFGSPAPGQHVSWTEYTQDRSTLPPGWEAYVFGDQDAIEQQAEMGMLQPSGPNGMFGAQVAQGEGTTDDAGRLRLQIPADLSNPARPSQAQPLDQTVIVEATVTDINHQPVSGRVQVAVHRSAFAIGLLPGRQVVPSGQQEAVDVAAVRDNGSPVPRQPLVATIYRRTYTTVLSNQRGMAGFWQRIAHDRLLFSHRLMTDAAGRARVTFTPQQGGLYYVAVEGKDSSANPARSGVSVYASAEGFSDFGQTSNATISLKPDKASYRVGETAHVLVAAPFDRAWAFITLERASIRSVQVQHLRSNSSIVDVPITPADLPNVYVTVTIYHGWRMGSPPDWRYGVANLHVKVDPAKLLVHLSQDRSRYHPGDAVTYTVRTTDVQGRPVSAQVSLSLVDTAVLALQDETNGDILQALYGERSLQVSTASDGLASVDALRPAEASGIGPICGLGGGGGGLGGIAPAASGLEQTLPSGVKLRRRFADTAYWRATLVTGDSGIATVHLRLPDNLTTWRLDARAVSADRRAGRALLRTQSTQDLILRPVTPRFFLQGDRLEVGVIVMNNLNRPLDVDVSAAVTGLSLRSPSRSRVTVGAHSERLVFWPLDVPEPESGLPGVGSASLMFQASPSTAGLRGDAVQVDLPVHPPLTDETVATSGEVFGSTRQLVAVPAGATDRAGALTVQLSSSLTAGIGAAYGALEPTPYPSNEDLANRVLAAAALRSLPAGLTGLSPTAYAGLTPTIDQGVAKLIADQLADGSWPWFNDAYAQSDPAITGDVVEALTASHVRSRLATRALQSGRRYLRGVLHSVPMVERIHLLSVLAISGTPDRTAMRGIYDDTVRRAHLDPAPLADLALGLNLGGDRTAARSLVALLESRVMVSGTGAHWEGMAVQQGRSATASTAAVLAALLRLAPRDALVPAAARWLLLARVGGAWDCQPVTAHALGALAAYARAVHEGNADYRYRVVLDGRTRLAGEAGQRAVSIDVPVHALHRRGESALEIRREAVNGATGLGPLYYVARLRYFLSAASIPARNEGIAISRRYLSLAGQSISSIAAGSVVKVELTLQTDQTLEYLHVDDPLPGGVEPIDQSLKTSRQGLFPAQQPLVYQSSGQPSETPLQAYLTHSDLRDDRVSLYATSVPPGRYTYTYLAQATTVGRYDVAPAHAEETFFPEVFGHSTGGTFTVR